MIGLGQVVSHFCISTFGNAPDDGFYVVDAETQIDLV
jgi:hypothetical protein